MAVGKFLTKCNIVGMRCARLIRGLKAGFIALILSWFGRKRRMSWQGNLSSGFLIFPHLPRLADSHLYCSWTAASWVTASTSFVTTILQLFSLSVLLQLPSVWHTAIPRFTVCTAIPRILPLRCSFLSYCLSTVSLVTTLYTFTGAS